MNVHSGIWLFALGVAGGFPLASGFGAVGVEGGQPTFPQEPGWLWQVSPSPPAWGLATTSGEYVVQLDEIESQRLRLTLAHTVSSSRGVVLFRPVAFDGSRKRIEFGFESGDSANDVAHAIAAQGLPWPNVFAPVERDQRGLWATASGSFALPRLLLIDRKAF